MIRSRPCELNICSVGLPDEVDAPTVTEPGPRFALLNPLGRLIDPDLAYGTGYQYEGYDYLGLGVIALVVVVVARQWHTFGTALRRHAVLASYARALFTRCPRRTQRIDHRPPLGPRHVRGAALRAPH